MGGKGGVGAFLEVRRAELQRLIDAAVPAATVTVEDVLDRVLAPLYLRILFGYTVPESRPEQLVTELLDRSG